MGAHHHRGKRLPTRAGLVAALVTGGLLVATPAEGQWGTIADIADFTWHAPNTDTDGDLRYEVSGTAPIRITVTAKPTRSFELVRVTLYRSSGTPSYVTCSTAYQGTLPTDFPTVIEVDLRWAVGTAPGAAVSCTTGALASQSGALPAGQYSVNVTVQQALDAAQITEGQSRMIEFPDDDGCTSNCGGSTTTTQPDDDGCTSNCGGSTTTQPDDDGCKTNCGGSTTTQPGRDGCKSNCGGSTTTQPDGDGRRRGTGGGQNGSGGGDDPQAGDRPRGTRGTDALSNRAERDVPGALSTSAERAVRAGRSPLVSAFITGGSILSPLLIILGLLVIALDRWWPFLLARRRRRKDEEDEEDAEDAEDAESAGEDHHLPPKRP